METCHLVGLRSTHLKLVLGVLLSEYMLPSLRDQYEMMDSRLFWQVNHRKMTAATAASVHEQNQDIAKRQFDRFHQGLGPSHGAVGLGAKIAGRKRPTQGLQCSSFLVMSYFLLRDYNIPSKKELHFSPWLGHILASLVRMHYDPP